MMDQLEFDQHHQIPCHFPRRRTGKLRKYKAWTNPGLPGNDGSLFLVYTCYGILNKTYNYAIKKLLVTKGIATRSKKLLVTLSPRGNSSRHPRPQERCSGFFAERNFWVKTIHVKSTLVHRAFKKRINTAILQSAPGNPKLASSPRIPRI